MAAESVVLESLPGTVNGLVRLALPSVPLVNKMPGVRKGHGFTPLAFSLPGAVPDKAHVDAYARVCGFALRDTLPITYPHMLAFGLHSAILASPQFPWPAMGLVHLTNSITSHRPVGRGEELHVSADLGQPQTHPKGTLLEFHTSVRSGDELVWESSSGYLKRGKPTARTPEQAASAPDSGAQTSGGTGLPWRLGADLGRRYAAVSGDHNPIHLYPLTAKALGFPRQIAHGMWSLAHCLALVDNRLPRSCRIDAEFKKPILLPSTVIWRHEGRGEQQEFSLRKADGSPHLIGSISAR